MNPPLDDAAPLVSLLPHRNLRGWPQYESGGRVSVVSLRVALTLSYRTDAHIAQYATPNARRLRSAAVDRVAPTLYTVMFDFDCPGVHGTPEPAPDCWRSETLERFRELERVHRALFYYETFGGARIVGRLDPPMVIGSRADAALWSQKYQIARAYLSRRFGLLCDWRCDEWNRLFRAPHATRKGQHTPEQLRTCGDAAHVGVLNIAEDERDLEAARRAKPTLFGATRAPRVRRVLELAPSVVSDGAGLLYHLLAARGWIVCEHASEPAFVVRCPNVAAHTTGASGDGSTLLYAPPPGEQTGFLHCFHEHCGGFSVGDWIRMFDKHERESARIAAGITSTRAA